jgi:hypothetical protein
MRRLAAALVTILMFSLASQEAGALPVFAHRYGFSCQVCHTTIPHLNPFGNAFLRAGFRLPQSAPSQGSFPVAIRANFQYSGAPDPNHLPKVIVDELEFLAGAPVGSHLSYKLEQYSIDGGLPGKTRDAWLSYTNRPYFGSVAAALRVTTGQFTLPLPNDPETQRDTITHYAIFDQTIGSNPFNLFDDRIGLDVAYGSQGGGLDLQAIALKAHDPQSGLGTSGVDKMFVAQEGSATMLFSAYRYDGYRWPGPVSDRFWRQALATNQYFGDAEIDVLFQEGRDSSADGRGLVVRSGGGYGQLRWAFSPAVVGIARFDSTYDVSQVTWRRSQRLSSWPPSKRAIHTGRRFGVSRRRGERCLAHRLLSPRRVRRARFVVTRSLGVARRSSLS